MTERPQVTPTSSHDELLARYHAANAQATDALPAARQQAMRERILQAAQSAQSKEMTSAHAAATAAANDSFWSIKAVASLAVMGLAALLYLQLGDQAQPEQGKPQAEVAVTSTAAVTAAATAPPAAPPSVPIVSPPPVAPAATTDVAIAASTAQPVSRQRETVKEKKLSQDSAVAARAQAVAPTAPVAAPAESAPPPVATAKSAADKEVPAKPMTQMLAPEARSVQEWAVNKPNFGARSRADAILGIPSPAQPDAVLQAISLSDAAALSSALSQENASPNTKNAQGVPALHLAVSRRWTEGVRLLLVAGADAQALDPQGLRASELARKLNLVDDDMLRLLER